MTATTAVAIYAAIIASGGLAWQVFTWLRSHRTRVEVEVRTAVIAFSGTDIPTVAMITVRNLSEHPIRVTSAGFDFQDGSGQAVVIGRMQPAANLPGVIAGRDAGNTYLEEEECRSAGLDLSSPLVAWAALAAPSKTFKSKPTTLQSRG